GVAVTVGLGLAPARAVIVAARAVWVAPMLITVPCAAAAVAVALTAVAVPASAVPVAATAGAVGAIPTGVTVALGLPVAPAGVAVGGAGLVRAAARGGSAGNRGYPVASCAGSARWATPTRTRRRSPLPHPRQQGGCVLVGMSFLPLV